MGVVLVLEDDISINSMVCLNLRRAGYEVLSVTTGEEAIRVFNLNDNIDIAVLDITLPGISGVKVCSTIREQNSMVGIVMLTAKSQDEDKVEALESGADDYMTKPFSPVELVARVNALHRRVKINTQKYIEEIIESYPFKININTRQCFKRDNEIILTPTEFMMLKIFIDNVDHIMSRDDLLREIWGENFYGDMKIVDVNIRRLRRKIEDDPSNPEFIETVWGKGYKWRNNKCHTTKA